MFRLFLFFVFGAVSQSVFSLEADSDQPAQIYADDIEFDFQTGVRTYIGNVTVEQGTRYIVADKLIANYDKEGNLTTANAWGNPARFKQRPDDKDIDTIGVGDEIIINQIENTLTLLQAAELTQGVNTARGENIVYNMNTDKLSIKGGQRGAQVATAGKGGTAPPPIKPRPTMDEAVANVSPEGGVAMTPESTMELDSESTTVTDSAAIGEATGLSEEDVDKAKQLAASSLKRTNDGRSRLIIMPKKEPKIVADKDELLDVVEEAIDDVVEDSASVVPATQ
ncbi:MAG: lipopolysaccharide transport periplasmic protein LptA [Proteobacteria bacterium]|nr:lipopolysaccharide transport periplasmic protein LptA [Pseudomonadota bacterium]